MKKSLTSLRNFLWVFVTAIFAVDFAKILMDTSLIAGSMHQQMINTFLRSIFALFELIMACLIIYFMIKYPERRLRLLSVSFFHYTFILFLPIAFKDFTWMAVLYPWPQTLLAFDPKTSWLVSALSLFVGFVVVPLLTFRWGKKGFCGYVCPHGAFYSEAYGRLFSPPAGRLKWLRTYLPRLYFLFMAVALALIFLVPSALDPVRQTQKVAFFLASQMLYLVVGVPLVGARSYCTHCCPLGYEIGLILRYKQNDNG
ncbi:4Fe-4S binding protein [bacterium]|nr:MAG: 4Fe-4S binding protein [bacterium]